MNANIVTLPISEEDEAVLRKLKEKAWHRVLRLYGLKDYRRLILPLERELQQRSKYCFSFKARKYLDPLYNKCLLFFPDKEDLYIEVKKGDFDSINNGEELKLEVAVVTGEVLALRSAVRDFYQPEEFNFSDQ